MQNYTLFSTPFGEMAVLWEHKEAELGIARILIPLPGQTVPVGLQSLIDGLPSQHPLVDELCAQIAGYLAGEPIDLPVVLLDRSQCSSFQWRVLMAEKAIPRGRVRTYAQVAAAAGSPRGARAAGNALATNPFPIVIPCHRAVRSDRSLGGYQGGQAMKRALLEMEGLRFDRQGRVLVDL